jgi:hypothetical protein
MENCDIKEEQRIEEYYEKQGVPPTLREDPR